MKFTKLAVLLSACLLFVGCSKSANTGNAGGTTSSTTTTTNSTKNTAAATPSPQPSTQATTSPTETKNTEMASSPEDAARGFFNAFGRHDRAAAAKFASEAAIAKLFKESTGTEGMQFQGCNDEEADLNCAWSYEGGGLIMHIKGSQSTGYRVESIEFIAD